MELNGLKIKLNEKTFLEIIHPLMNKILRNNEKTRTWVGQKKDGIYIGFRREQIMKMEKEWGGRLRRRVFIRDPP